ncbi:MAG: tRNA 2-selenouridine(34) synthase MnmH [Bacteroidetes bacterium]|nr:tRNA 2-selenouridine(34) synthase MnmH [Bacteroidota bacterium]
MPTAININEFLKLSETNPIVDVRTPAEFVQGHIIGAHNLPLFTNEERILIGTLYKKEGKQPAILKGLEVVGPKLHEYVKDAIKLNKTGTFLVHCWRGGMRSSSMAWFLETYGFKCITLKGGYKNYRKHVLESFLQPKNILILGGKTGTGKTIVLHELFKQKEQIIDLEKIAHHKGSSFGSLGEEDQLSQEHFENELSFHLSKIDPKKNCWIENESRMIGKNILPIGLWEQMQKAIVVSINLPIEERVNYLAKEYGKFDKKLLIAATERIGKRLGGQHVKRAISALEEGDHKTAFEICLVYYDKTYNYGEEQRAKEKIIQLEFEKMEVETIAKEIIKAAHK